MNRQSTEYLNGIRELNPKFSNYDDDRLYYFLRRQDKLPGHAIDESVDARLMGRGQKATDTEDPLPNNDIGIFASMMDGPVKETSASWLKDAYNRSLTGLSEQLWTGKQRYKLPETYDPNVVEDILATAVSFLMPLDFISMFVGGAIGKSIAKPIQMGMQKKAGVEFTKQGIVKSGIATEGLNISQQIGLGAIRGAPPLAVYEGSLGGVDAKLNGEDVMPAIVEGVMHGGAMGMLVGGIGGGMAAKQAELFAKADARIAKHYGKKPVPLTRSQERMAKYGYNWPGQIVAESGAFTSVEAVERVATGEDLKAQDLLASFAKNMGLFSVLKVQHKITDRLWNGSKELYKESLKEELDKLSKEKQQESLDKVSEDLESTRDVENAAENIVKNTLNKMSQTDRTKLKDIEAEIKRTDKEFKANKKVLEKGNLDYEGAGTDLGGLINTINGRILPSLEKIVKQYKGKHGLSPILKEKLKTAEEYLSEWTEIKDSIDKAAREYKADKAKKEAPVFSEKKIIEEFEKLGLEIKDYTEDGVINRKEASRAIKDLKTEEAERKGKEKGVGVKDVKVAVEDVLISKPKIEVKDLETAKSETREQLKSKGEEPEIQRKFSEEVGKNYEKIEKAKEEQTEGTTKREKLEESLKVVHEHNETIYVGKKGTTVAAGSIIRSGPKRVREMLNFAKELAKKGKSFFEATAEDMRSYLDKNSTHWSAMQDLRRYLVDNQYQNKLKGITPDEIAGYGKPAKTLGLEGMRADKPDLYSWGDGKLRHKIPKSVEVIEKHISNTLEKGLNKEKKRDADTGHETFLHKDSKGKALNSDSGNKIIKILFGKKKIKKGESYIRKFRESFVAWAQEIGAKKLNIPAVDAEKMVRRWVLFDKTDMTKIDKAYSGNKQAEVVKKLVKGYIKDVYSNNPSKIESGEKYYTPHEIRKGLNKLEKRGDKVSIADKTINKETLETLVRQLIETSPRVNEVLPTQAVIKNAIATAKEIIKPVVKSTKSQKQVESAIKEERAQSFREQQEGKKKWGELYPELKIEIVKDLGTYKGEKILGQITGHLINVVKGKSDPSTIPHEVSHHVVNVLKKFGDRVSKKIIKDGIRKFGSEEKLVQAIAEYSLKKPQSKSMQSRVKSFLERAVSYFKSALGIENKRDIERLLTFKLQTGGIPRSKEISRYINKLKSQNKTEGKTNKELNIKLHKVERQLKDEGVSKSELNDLRVEFFGNKTFEEGKVANGTLERYVDEISKMRGKSSGRGRRVNEASKKFDIDPEIQRQILEAIGVKGGDVNNIRTNGAVRLYEQYARQYGKEVIPKLNSVDHMVLLDAANKDLPGIMARTTMPIWYVLRKFGGEPGRKLSRKINDFDITVTHYQGEGYYAYSQINKLLKGKTKHMWLTDKERRESYIKENKLTAEESNFIKELNVEGSPVNEAVKIWKSITDFYWESYKTEAKAHHGRVEYKEFLEKFNEKFVNDYFTRRLTPKALEYIVEAKNGEYIKDLVKENMKTAATQKAIKDLKGRKLQPSDYSKLKKEKIEKYLKDANLKLEIETDIFNILGHKHNLVKNKHLMKRGPLIPEFIEIVNKNNRVEKIRTYETKFQNVAEPYLMSMSKHLATVKHFPEWTNMGGKYKMSGTKPALLNSKILNSKFGEYAEQSIKRVVGIEEGNPLLRKQYGALSVIANTSAYLGLSSPLSGIKNLAIGIPRSIASYGLWNTMRGLRMAFNPDAINSARRKGALDYGQRTLNLREKGPAMFTMEKLWNINFMNKSENINRIASMFAGLQSFREMLPYLRGEGTSFFMGKNFSYKEAKRMMKDQWRLSEKQIEYLEKGDLSKSEYAGIEVLVEHWSHVSSQGGTNVGNMPLWSSSTLAKPFTLFQRMAYATTFDAGINYVRPLIKNGNAAPMAKALAGSYLSGAALYAMYDWLFATENPKAAGTSLDTAVSYLWRGETFGIFGDFASPYKEGLTVSFMEPVIYRNAKEGWNNFVNWKSGGKSTMQAAGDFTKRTFVLLNQGDRLLKRAQGEFYENAKRLNTLNTEYRRQMGKPVNRFSDSHTYSKRYPFYRDLKETILSKVDKDAWAKKAFAAYNYIVTDLEKTEPNLKPRARHKKAIKAILSSMERMNPIGLSDDTKGKYISDKKLFMKWLLDNKGQSYVKMAEKTISSAEYKKRIIEKILKNDKYKKTYSVYHGLF